MNGTSAGVAGRTVIGMRGSGSEIGEDAPGGCGTMTFMIALKAHFDGKVLVPDEPLALAPNQRVRITVEPIESIPSAASTEPKPKRVFGLQPDVVTYLAPDWEDPLPDDIWDHNKDDEAKP